MLVNWPPSITGLLALAKNVIQRNGWRGDGLFLLFLGRRTERVRVRGKVGW